MAEIDLCAGKRTIVPYGVYVPKYQITVSQIWLDLDKISRQNADHLIFAIDDLQYISALLI